MFVNKNFGAEPGNPMQTLNSHHLFDDRQKLMNEIKTLREMNSQTKRLTSMIVHDLIHPTRAVVNNLK